MNIDKKLSENTSLKGIWRFTLEDIHTGIKRIFEYYNLIPTVGRTVLANNLTNSVPTVTPIRITFTALGTGATAPANGDTQLETETFRKATASSTNSNNVAYATAFYTAPEVSGTFAEAGLFIGGSITPNSGTLFSRVAISITKSLTETLTIDYTVTIT